MVEVVWLHRSLAEETLRRATDGYRYVAYKFWQKNLSENSFGKLSKGLSML